MWIAVYDFIIKHASIELFIIAAVLFFAYLSPQFAKIEARFSKIDVRFSEIDARFSVMDDKFSEMNMSMNYRFDLLKINDFALRDIENWRTNEYGDL
jgi:glutaredoxin-related protein